MAKDLLFESEKLNLWLFRTAVSLGPQCYIDLKAVSAKTNNYVVQICLNIIINN